MSALVGCYFISYITECGTSRVGEEKPEVCYGYIVYLFRETESNNRNYRTKQKTIDETTQHYLKQARVNV